MEVRYDRVPGWMGYVTEGLSSTTGGPNLRPVPAGVDPDVT
jgi:hypothetical protein